VNEYRSSLSGLRAVQAPFEPTPRADRRSLHLDAAARAGRHRALGAAALALAQSRLDDRRLAHGRGAVRAVGAVVLDGGTSDGRADELTIGVARRVPGDLIV